MAFIIHQWNTFFVVVAMNTDIFKQFKLHHFSKFSHAFCVYIVASFHGAVDMVNNN